MYWRSLIAVSLGFLITWQHNGISSAAEPGYLDFDNLPDTNFSCEGKVIGGYYADIETGCQMFHVCTIGQKGEITDIKFLCLNGTVFDQETRVCERLDEVDCSKSESFFDLNLELYGNNGAGFGIQPEGEESEDLIEECDPDNDDDCNTDSPSIKNESQEGHEEEVEEEIIEELEETTTLAPITSTTTRRPLPSSTTSSPSTTPSPPKVYNYPTSSQETVAALLALHNAFTASLQQHADPQKPKPNPPQITGFISNNPSNSGGFHSQHHSSLSPSRPPTQFTPPAAPDELQNFQSQKQNYQNLNNKQNNYQNPIQTTSEHYGNGNFHHEFHINSQTGHFPVQNFQNSFRQQHQSASAIPQTSRPKPFQFHQFDDNNYYVKTHSSTVTPFILHQLKVNRLKENQESSKGSVAHGSYVRDVSSAGKSHKNGSFRSQTTPAIAVVTSTSTTSSSSSTKSGKFNPSAITNRQPQLKQFAHSTNPSRFSHSIENLNKTLTHNNQGHLSTYDDYQESDVQSDPFFKDVPKLGRSKRYAQFNAQRMSRRQRPIESELPVPFNENEDIKTDSLTTLQPITNRRTNRRRPSTFRPRESLPIETLIEQPRRNLNQQRKQTNTTSISNVRPLQDLANIEVSTKPIPSRRTSRRKPVIKSTTEETVTEWSEMNIVPPSTPQTPGSKFTCDQKIKGGYYADIESNCLGFFICSQGEVNGPLLKTHFWCGATTKFNQRSRTCQAEDNVVCSISERYFHLNQDFLVPAPEDEIRDSFEPQKVQT